MQSFFAKGSFDTSSSWTPRPLLYSPKCFFKRGQGYLPQRQWQTCAPIVGCMCVDQIPSCCVYQLHRIMSAENMPFALRMCSFPLVLWRFAFFNNNSKAYYQMELLNVLHVSKTMPTAGSVSLPSGTPAATDSSRKKDFSLFVNCCLFSACDLPQQGLHTRHQKLAFHPLILCIHRRISRW